MNPKQVLIFLVVLVALVSTLATAAAKGPEGFKFWSVNGNAGTDPAADFLGTTDNQPLIIKTNGTERMLIDTAGNVGISADVDATGYTESGSNTLNNSISGTASALAADGTNCPTGKYSRGVDASGNAQDCTTESDTTYTAGPGLSLSLANEFSTDTSVVQARVSSTCSVGSSIRAINADGTVICEADTDTDTTYTAGAGLSLTGTQFSTDTSVVQARVSSTCSVGSSIRAINANGTVICEADTDTTYIAGFGLSLTGTQFSADASAVQVRVDTACNVGSSIRVINADGSVVCETDTDTTYSGADFAVSNQACTTGQVVTGVDASGGVVCAPDADTDTDTTYSGADFAVSNQACTTGQVVTGVDASGGVVCGSIVSGYHILTNTPFAGVVLHNTGVKAHPTASCPTGEKAISAGISNDLSGGFSDTAGFKVGLISPDPGGQKWFIGFLNTTGKTTKVTLHVVCMKE